MSAVTDKQGSFRASVPTAEVVVHAINADRTLSGAIRLNGAEQEIVVPISATASAKGRIVDPASGEGLANREIEFVVQYVPPPVKKWSLWKFNASATTNGRGEFIAKGLTTGWTYDIHLIVERDTTGSKKWHHLGTVAPVDATQIDLGDLTYRPGP